MPSSMPTGFACPRKGSPILARTGDWSMAYFATGGVTAALREAMRRSFLRTFDKRPKQTQCFAPACHFLSPPVRRRSLNRLLEIHLSRKMACCLSMNGRFAPEGALRSALLYPRGLTVAQAFVLAKRGQVARRTSEKSPAKAGRKVKRRSAAMSKR